MHRFYVKERKKRFKANKKARHNVPAAEIAPTDNAFDSSFDLALSCNDFSNPPVPTALPRAFIMPANANDDVAKFSKDDKKEDDAMVPNPKDNHRSANHRSTSSFARAKLCATR